MALQTRHFSLDLPAETTPEDATQRGRVEAVGNPIYDFELVDITPSEVSGMRRFKFQYKTGFPE